MNRSMPQQIALNEVKAKKERKRRKRNRDRARKKKKQSIPCCLKIKEVRGVVATVGLMVDHQWTSTIKRKTKYPKWTTSIVFTNRCITTNRVPRIRAVVVVALVQCYCIRCWIQFQIVIKRSGARSTCTKFAAYVLEKRRTKQERRAIKKSSRASSELAEKSG